MSSYMDISQLDVFCKRENLVKLRTILETEPGPIILKVS